MPKQKKKKKKKKAKKSGATKVILMPNEETDQEDTDEDDEESGIYLDKDSVQIIYNALSTYKPTKDEENVYWVLHEQFEEMLVVDYGVRLPGFEFMDEEEN
jgi:hypothetical protein